MLDLRSPDSTEHLFLFFSFQFSFFLWIKLGLFLMFPFAFIFFSLITHIYFSLLENDLRRTVRYLIGCYQYYRSKSILFLKLYGSSNVILIENFNQNEWMITTKRAIFNKLFFVSFEQDNTIDCAKCRIYTSKMAV